MVSSESIAPVPALSVRQVSKRFGNLAALTDIKLDFVAGEIHCILGENGAGKSTLMNILNGVLSADSGEIVVAGQRVELLSPRQARAVGIGMVHQHFTLIDAMSVAENLALSVPVKAGMGGLRLDRAAVAQAAKAFAERVGVVLPAADARVRDLAVGERQRLEILKALIAADKVLILDEPTAVLTPSEVDQLFVLLRELRAQGRLVIFITHKLREVKDVADRVTVMRRGRVVATHTVATVSEAALAEDMVGESLVAHEPTMSSINAREVVVELDHVSTTRRGEAPALVDVNLQIRSGEILGVAGVDGNGQRELFEVLVGFASPSAGRLSVSTAPEPRPQTLTPRQARAAGIACIPPDRHREGLALSMSVADNFLLSTTALDRFTEHGLLDHATARKFATVEAGKFAIRFTDLDQAASGLSGGNQQRVILARELAHAPKVLVAVNPTRGLDVQATQTVAKSIRAAAANGCAVVLISTDLDELLDLSHRVAVLFRGQLSEPITPPFDTRVLGQLMAGAA